MINTNWAAVFVSAVFAMGLGFIWYSPVMFAKQWMKLTGMTKEKIEKAKKSMPLMYGTQFLAAVVEIWVLSMFVNFVGAADAVTGAIVGFWSWLGFVATIAVGDALFNGKSTKLVAINAGYQLALLVVTGAILGAWH